MRTRRSTVQHIVRTDENDVQQAALNAYLLELSKSGKANAWMVNALLAALPKSALRVHAPRLNRDDDNKVIANEPTPTPITPIGKLEYGVPITEIASYQDDSTEVQDGPSAWSDEPVYADVEGEA